MQLEAKKTERITVDVHPREAWDALRAKLLARGGISEYWHLKADGWFYEKEEFGRCTAIDAKQIAATPEQKKLYEAVQLLNELVKELTP